MEEEDIRKEFSPNPEFCFDKTRKVLVFAGKKNKQNN
jgi:hypothetical protein